MNARQDILPVISPEARIQIDLLKVELLRAFFDGRYADWAQANRQMTALLRSQGFRESAQGGPGKPRLSKKRNPKVI